MKTFIMSLAGYDSNIAKRCPGNSQNKYAAMGAAVLITTLMACFGGYHLANDIVSNKIAALGFALFWGSIVFGFEYMMINLFNNSSKGKWAIFSMRILMSIAISLLISTPFVLMLFQGTIKQRLAEEQKAKIENVETDFMVQKAIIDTALAVRFRSVIEHEKIAVDEAIGIGGTGLKGMGKWFTYKNDLLKNARKEDSTYRVNAAANLLALETNRDNNISSIKEFYSHDFLSQIMALLKLMREKGIVIFETILILLVLLLFDLMPIILKSTSSLKDEDDPYNQLVKLDKRHKLELGRLSLRNVTQNRYNEEMTTTELSPANAGLRTFKAEASSILLVYKTHQEYLALIEDEFKDNENIRNHAKRNLDLLSANSIDGILKDKKTSDYSDIELSDQYHAYIADIETLTPHHPFAADQNIINTVKELCKPEMDEEQKFNVLFEWITVNIPYDIDHDNLTGYRTAIDTFSAKTGICGELTALLVTMCRVAGIKADYVSVSKDDKGADVIHACAGISIKGSFRMADPSYKNSDVLHQVYAIKSDEDVLKNFISWNNS